MATAEIDRVRRLISSIGSEKQASGRKNFLAGGKSAMEDPGSSHPTDVPEAKGNEQGEQTGSFASENEKKVKEQVPQSVDATPEVSPGSAPKADEGRVDEAKDTGKDPGVEDDYKDRPDNTQDTTHPADASVGEKYSSFNLQDLAGMPTQDLYKLAAELGNDVAADLANGLFVAPAKPASAPAKSAAAKPAEGKPATKQAVNMTGYCNEHHNTYQGESCPECSAKEAASQGFQDAAAAGEVTKQAAFKLAQEVYVNEIRKADRVIAYLHKVAEEGDEGKENKDPTGGSSEGESHEESPSGDGGGDDGSGGGAPPPGKGDNDLLAAMSGGASGAGGPGGGAPAADPLAGGGGGGGMPGGAPGMPGMGGGMPGGGMGGGMPGGGHISPEQLIQALLMALSETNTSPDQLAGMGPTGAKMAALANEFNNSGKFRFKIANGEERKQIDYFKGYISELSSRSRR